MRAMLNDAACFTGHRRIPKAEYDQIKHKLEKTISQLTTQGILRYLNGAARGFDTLAAHIVLTARENNPAIELVMALPCINQDERWDEIDKETYRVLLGQADEIIYVSEQPYFDGCMKARNQYLIENSGTCVAYMKRGRSGTSQTVRLAREHGLDVINLAEG